MRCAAACLAYVAAVTSGEAANAQPPAEDPAEAAGEAVPHTQEPSPASSDAEQTPPASAEPEASPPLPPPPPPTPRQPTTTYPAPGAPPPGVHPPPEVASTEYLRYSAELIPGLGLAVPRCKEGERSSLNCEGVKAGGQAGFTALWRVSPYFAVGGSLDITALRYLPPDELNRNNAAAGSVYLGLAVRAYFLQEGSIEPYLELGLGGGALATEFDEEDELTQEEIRYEETGAGPAVQFGAGIDFYLGPHLRLGPAVAYTQVSVDKTRRCRSGGQGDCRDLPKDEDGYLHAYATIGARLTILLGDEL